MGVLLRIVVLSLVSSAVDSVCPCKNPDWCKPITEQPQKEIYIFSVVNNATVWNKFDWTRVTTVSGKIYPDLMCLAHQHGVRVAPLVDYPGADLTNTTKRTAWVQKQLSVVTDNYYDGVNIDFEEEIPQSDTKRIQGLTELVQETYQTFKRKLPHSQISMDVPYGANCVYDRCYDYKNLSSYLDFFVIMDYDEWGGLYAGPNSGILKTFRGLKTYVDLDIQPSKLVMAFPWYGYKYKCISITLDGHCIHSSSSQMIFSEIYNLLSETHSKRMWNETEQSPYFTYKDSTNTSYQIWYDDPESLIYKYDFAARTGIRGVGVWQAEAVDYSDTPLANAVRQWMWDALPLRGNKNKH